MELTRREQLAKKLTDKEPLSLDDRVYWHEAKAVRPRWNGDGTMVEPVLQTAQDVKDFFQKHGRIVTDESISTWLDGMNVPK